MLLVSIMHVLLEGWFLCDFTPEIPGGFFLFVCLFWGGFFLLFFLTFFSAKLGLLLNFSLKQMLVIKNAVSATSHLKATNCCFHFVKKAGLLPGLEIHSNLPSFVKHYLPLTRKIHTFGLKKWKATIQMPSIRGKGFVSSWVQTWRRRNVERQSKKEKKQTEIASWGPIWVYNWYQILPVLLV